jgi:hypothetical protein
MRGRRRKELLSGNLVGFKSMGRMVECIWHIMDGTALGSY